MAVRDQFPIAHVALLRGETLFDRAVQKVLQTPYSGCGLLLEGGLFRQTHFRLCWIPLNQIPCAYDVLAVQGMDLDLTYGLKVWHRSFLVHQTSRGLNYFSGLRGPAELAAVALRARPRDSYTFPDLEKLQKALKFVGVRLGNAKTPEELLDDEALVPVGHHPCR